jgi:hypothetical protein
VAIMNNQSLVTLHSWLMDALPPTIHGANEKTSKSSFKPTDEALHDKFIRYGTKKSVNVIIFDHDYIKLSLKAYAEWLEEKINIKPTFITKTTNGYQFGFILNRPIFKFKYDTKLTDEYKQAQELKKRITRTINADAQGSHRLIGIWRNPLEHEHIFNEKKYSLLTIANKSKATKTLFDYESENSTEIDIRAYVTPTNEDNFLDDICNFEFEDTTPGAVNNQVINLNAKMRMSTNGITQDAISKGFTQGNRNNFLFAIGYKIVFEDRRKSLTLENELMQINKSQDNPLTDYEVLKIYESIAKLIPTMYQPRTEKTKGKYFKEMQENGVHGLYNRRAYAGFAVARDRTVNQVENILKELVSLFNQGVTNPTNQVVADEAEISIRTYQRVKKFISSSKVFLEWIKALQKSTEIDIRAYVTPILNRLYFGINKRIEMLENGSKLITPLQKSEIMQMKPIT